MSDQRKKKWRGIITGATFVGLALLVFFARESITETLTNLQEVTGWILLFMIFWQIINYHAYTELYRNIFITLGKKISYKKMITIVSELNFVNTVFPSAGVAGFSYIGYRMKDFKVSAPQATLVHLMRFVSVFFAFQILLIIGVIILSFDGKANNFTILVAGSIGTALVIGSSLATYIVGNKKRIDSFTAKLTKFINKLIHAVRPNHPETIKLSGVKELFIELHDEYILLKKDPKNLKKPLIYGTLAIFAEIATLYTVFLAFGEPVNFGAVILAYAVANFAGIISVFPGGVGVYEALMTGVLAIAGVPPSIGLPATIMYRIISMTIQLPIGYYFYSKFLKNMGITREELSQ